MKPGRNDECWCKSGNKYKYCHERFDLRIDQLKKDGNYVPPKSMIKNEYQIEMIKKAAIINNGLLDYIEENIKPGISTLDIDDMAVKYLKEHDAESADLNYHGYPKSICTSVNDVICHGIPSEKVILKDGDIINVDATTKYKDFYADASRMYEIGNVSINAKRLVEKTKECLQKGLDSIIPWQSTIGDIGKAIEKCANEAGYTVVEEYCGHGVGLSMHEDPYVYHYETDEKTVVIVPGMVFTIEPMINEGTRFITFKKGDTWSSYTKDGKLSAQVEHTILITDDGYEILSK